MSNRRIVCPSCNTIFSEKLLQEKGSENQCLVCGASLNVDESESTPEEQEELVTWYYIEFKNSNTYFIIEESKAKKDKMSPDMELKYTFQAPPRDEKNGSEAAKEVLRREYKPDAFMESESSTVSKPAALWIAEGKCPRCHSSNIQIVPRKWSIWTGFRTNRVDRVCVNCKHRF